MQNAEKIRIRHYPITDTRISKVQRILLISDIHSETYRYDTEKLMDRINAEYPTLVLLAGDVFDGFVNHPSLHHLLSFLGKNYETYSVIGNHELAPANHKLLTDQGKIQRRIERLKREYADHKITLLSNEVVNLKGLSIAGINDEHAFASSLDYLSEINQKASEMTSFRVLLTHEPKYYEQFQVAGYNLVLCGHTHGGQIRIPGILNGLYTPDQGFFPKYAGGHYEKTGTHLIVNRGLSNSTAKVPRIFNPPEMSLIELI